MRKDVAPSLGEGGKTTAKIETKTTIKSPPTMTAKVWGPKNFKVSKWQEMMFCQVWKKEEKDWRS